MLAEGGVRSGVGQHGVGRGACRGDGWRLGGQVEVLEDAADGARLGEEGELAHPTAVVADQDVDLELKKRTAILNALKDVFRRSRSQPTAELIQRINPILRGWVNYFAQGHSSVCFSFVRDWVEKKIRRHLGRARGRQGFGWKRWSRRWLYDELGLFRDYRVKYMPWSKAAPA